MTSQLNPYLSFDGNAREAMEFYGEVFGAEPVFSTYGDFGEPPSSEAGRIMHARLDTPRGYTLMAADHSPGTPYVQGNSMAISLGGDDEDALLAYWEKLSERGVVNVPMEKQVWGDVFGMCTDQFGVTWMVNIATAQPS